MFERLIRSITKWLKKLLGQYITNFEHLHTLLAEIQTVINDTPFKVSLCRSYRDDDPREELLTPNHLLFGRKINLLVEGVCIPLCEMQFVFCQYLHSGLQFFN